MIDALRHARCAGCCGTRPATLVVAVATLVLTIVLYVIVPKGFFPDPGHRRDPRHLARRPQDVSFAAMAERQQALARIILQGPGRGEPLVLHRRRRHEHDAQQRPHPDQPQAARRARRRRHATIIRRLQPALEPVEGITLYMQPVQDLTVENRVSRTQYQYTLEDADARELAEWAPRLVEKLQTLPELRDVASDQQTGGLQASRRDRPRHGLAPGRRCRRPSTTRSTTPSASARSRPSSPSSTSTTSCSRWSPRFQQSPGGAERDLRASRRRRRAGAAERVHPRRRGARRRWRSTTRASSRSVTLSFNLAPGAALGDAVDAIQAAEREIGLPAVDPRELPGHRAGLPGLARQRAAPDPGRAHHRLHRAGRALRELHPPDHDPLDAAVGRASARSWPCSLCRADLDVIALIGIILLIGIVKKNAIMMIDFALDAERKEGKPPGGGRSTRPACSASGRS